MSGTREGAGPIVGSNETSKEEIEDGSTTEEEQTKSRRISAGVRRYHTNYQRIMVRARYKPS